MYVVTFSGTFTGADTVVVHGRHPDFLGQGVLWARFIGKLEAPGGNVASAGGESFSVESLAGPDYNGTNPVTATWTGPGGNLPINLSGYRESWGWYTNSRELTGTVTFDTVVANESFNMTGTGYFGEEVPEPVTLLGVGLVLLAARAWRAWRFSSPRSYGNT